MPCELLHITCINSNIPLSEVYIISALVMRLLTVVLLFFSVFFCFRIYNPAYLRSFPVYCLIDAVTEVVWALFDRAKEVAYFSFTFFELLYFSYFLSFLCPLLHFL